MAEEVQEWGGFPDHLQSLVGSALTTGRHSDVTLVCQDLQVFRSHKLILAASSPVFSNILHTSLDCVYLRGVRGTVLASILQFIYLGKVQVPADRLKEFLETAQDLQIEGIITSFEIPSQETELENISETGQTEKLNEISEDNDLEIIDYQQENEIVQATITEKNNYKTPVEKGSGPKEQMQKPFRNHPLYDGDVDKPKARSKCPECDNSYHPRWKLVRHYKLKHEGIRFMCDQCGQQFGKDTNLKRHLMDVHKYTKAAAASSMKNHNLADGGKKEKHFLFLTEKPKSKCPVCDKEFAAKHQMVKHFKATHQGKKHFCDKCPAKFSTTFNLSRHVRELHGSGGHKATLSCGQCGYETNSRYKLEVHSSNKHEGVKHGCGQCGKEFTLKSSLKLHIKSLHDWDWEDQPPALIIKS